MTYDGARLGPLAGWASLQRLRNREDRMPDQGSQRRAWVLAGLAAGSISAVPTALLSLPLKSPDDALFNSATVAGGTVVFGVVAGAFWRLLARRPNPWVLFTAIWAAGFGVVAALTAIGESPVLEGMLPFVLSLAALAFALTGALTPWLARPLASRWWAAPAALVVALAIGIPLAGQGDQESGELALPPISTTTSATPTALAAPTPTPIPLTATTTPPTPSRDGGPISQPVATATPVPAATATPAAAPTTPAPPPRAVGQYSGVNFVIGQGSVATFTVREKLVELPLPNDAVVKNTAITGEVHLDGRPSVIKLDLQGFTSDQRRRDNFLRTTIFRNTPPATITVEDLRHAPDGVQKGQVLTGEVTAKFNLNASEYPLTFSLEGRDDGDVIYLLGRTRFQWKDIGMTAPSIRGIVQVTDDVTVEVLIAARPAA